MWLSFLGAMCFLTGDLCADAERDEQPFQDAILGDTPVLSGSGRGTSSEEDPSPLDEMPDLNTPEAPLPYASEAPVVKPDDKPSLTTPAHAEGSSLEGLLDGNFSAYHNIRETSVQLGLNDSPTILSAPNIPLPTQQFIRENVPFNNYGPFRAALQVDTSLAYVNNVLGSTTNPQSDSTYTIRPKLRIEAGTKGYFSLDYSPTFTRYTRFSDLDQADQSLSMAVKYPFTKLELGAQLLYRTQSGLFVNSQGNAQEQTYQSRLYASYTLSAKTIATVAVLTSLENMDPGGSKLENNLVGNVLYRITDSLSTGGSLVAGHLQAPGGYQDHLTIQASINYRPGYHFQVEGYAGAEVRSLTPPAGGLNELVTPVWDITASYYRTYNFVLAARFYRLVNSDTFQGVSLQIQTGVEAYLLLRLVQRFDLRLGVAAGYNEQLSDGDPPTSNFCSFQGGLSISYPLLKTADLIFFATVQQRFADSLGQDYMTNTTGLALSFRF